MLKAKYKSRLKNNTWGPSPYLAEGSLPWPLVIMLCYGYYTVRKQ